MQLLRVAALAAVFVCAMSIAFLFGGNGSGVLQSARSRAAVRKAILEAAVEDAMADDRVSDTSPAVKRVGDDGVETHNTLAPLSMSLGGPPPVRRWMFVGDSITEGIAPGSAKRFRVPRDGSCSYRFALLRLLRGALGNDSITTVGPYHCALGGETPQRCCAAVGDGSNAPDCIARYGQHGGIWGGEFQDFLNVSSNQLYAKRYQSYRNYFRKRAGRFAPWSIESPQALMGGPVGSSSRGGPQSLSPLQRWVSAFRPNVVLVLTGTNDLHVNAGALDMCRAWYPLMLHHILKHPESTPVIVGISTLLLRVATDVVPLNRLMLAIRRCKHTATSKEKHTPQASCRTCVGDVFSAEAARNASLLTLLPPNAPPPPMVDWGVWCSEAVHILHVGNATTLPNTTDCMYDGLHPSEVGENALASVLMDEMQRTGMLQSIIEQWTKQ